MRRRRQAQRGRGWIGLGALLAALAVGAATAYGAAGLVRSAQLHSAAAGPAGAKKAGSAKPGSAKAGSAAGPSVSTRTVSNRTEAILSRTLLSSVPEITELYIQRMSDSGLSIVGTASLTGYPDIKALAQGVSSRFIWTAYNTVAKLLPGTRIDYAALYTEADGRYVMAAGLGRTESKKIAVSTLAPDEGAMLTRELAAVDRYSGSVLTQAFAEYKPS